MGQCHISALTSFHGRVQGPFKPHVIFGPKQLPHDAETGWQKWKLQPKTCDLPKKQAIDLSWPCSLRMEHYEIAENYQSTRKVQG